MAILSGFILEIVHGPLSGATATGSANEDLTVCELRHRLIFSSHIGSLQTCLYEELSRRRVGGRAHDRVCNAGDYGSVLLGLCKRLIPFLIH